MRHLRTTALVALASIAAASDPLSYHGGSILAMAGKDSVALVLDRRLGAGNNLIGDEAQRVLEAGPRSLLAVRGLQGDVQTLLEDVARPASSARVASTPPLRVVCVAR